MQDLNGKVALVTGAAKRLGRETALALAQRGASIVIHYRSSEAQAQIVYDRVRSTGVDAWIIKADLSDLGQSEDLFSVAAKSAGGIDILINSASIFPNGTLFELDEGAYIDNLKVNALAPLRLSTLFASQKNGGTIINLLDTRMLDYDKNHVPYHLSKHALFLFTRMLSVELAPDIRVNAVAPGLILPPEGKDLKYLRELSHTNPLHRWGSAKDITDAILYLIGARFVTGQILYVDGGRHIKGRVYGS
ncbi:MAG: dehydrogenase [Spirochaetales bacterium]|nr:dehydrogenase [Spirochaetales bacterium]